MLDLESIVTRFVDDLLGVLRQASIDDLREIFADQRAPSRAPRAIKARANGGRVELEATPVAEQRIVTTRAPERPAAPARTRKKARAKERVRVVSSASASASKIVAEITDPEGLLAAALMEAPPAPPPPPPAPPPPPDEEPPSSGDRTMVLREGERLAREGSPGVVIRRAKRA